MFQLNHDDNMLHFNEMMMMMMMMMMVSACTRPTCLDTDLNGARLLQQQSVGTHVASLISGYTCRLTHQWVHMSLHSYYDDSGPTSRHLIRTDYESRI